METMPSTAELIEAVTECLRDELLPALSGRAAFQARVAAGVLAIARRELLGAPRADAAEAARLRALLADPALAPDPSCAIDVAHTVDPARGADPGQGADPALATNPATNPALGTDPAAVLRAALCDAIRAGRVDLATPGLAAHLWADVLARLAIEQPTYPGYVRETAGDRTETSTR
jgi:hypothetical protein